MPKTKRTYREKEIIEIEEPKTESAITEIFSEVEIADTKPICEEVALDEIHMETISNQKCEEIECQWCHTIQDIPEKRQDPGTVWCKKCGRAFSISWKVLNELKRRSNKI
jgi:hypothetical protein